MQLVSLRKISSAYSVKHQNKHSRLILNQMPADVKLGHVLEIFTLLNFNFNFLENLQHLVVDGNTLHLLQLCS